MNDVSLCLLVLNEYEGCRASVPLIRRHLFKEVFAIDGGSDDRTVEYLEEQGIRVFSQRTKSLNAAYHQAVECATQEHLLIYFPKGGNPDSLLPILEKTSGKQQMVVASRNIAGGHNEEDDHWWRPRKWGVMALAWFASLVWRRKSPKINDVLHGIKGFSKSAFRKMAISPTGVTVDLEMTVRAYRLEMEVCEVPFVESSRLAGQSHFPILRTGCQLVKFLIGELFNANGFPPKN